MKKEPPLALVKTWVELLSQSDDKECREHAQRMLLGAFDSQQAVTDYLKLHNLLP